MVLVKIRLSNKLFFQVHHACTTINIQKHKSHEHKYVAFQYSFGKSLYICLKFVVGRFETNLVITDQFYPPLKVVLFAHT
jgi:hypothetical protein